MPKFFLISILVAFFFNAAVNAQNINDIKKLMEQGRYAEAAAMLKPLYNAGNSDSGTAWLYAIALHESGKVDEAQKIYWQLAHDFPYNNDIKIDRIHKLMDAGRLDEAEYLLQTTMNAVPEYYRFLSHLAMVKIAWWRGDYDKALEQVDKALYIYPTEKSAGEWKRKIIEKRSNYLTTDFHYTTDDQPLDLWHPSVKADFYFNSHFTAGVDAGYPSYSYGSSGKAIPLLRVRATYRFIPATTDVSVNAGVFSAPDSPVKPIYGISIGHRFAPHWEARLSYQTQPYTATVYAVENPLVYSRAYFHVAWENPGGIQAKALATTGSYQDTPYSGYTLAAWALSPPARWKALSFRAGYGFNYSNSDENAFVSRDGLEEIMDSWTEDLTVTGVYNPVFTPSNQTVHSLVALLDMKISENTSIQLKGGYGIAAKTDAPYLYLDSDGQGNTYIARDFARTQYHPAEAEMRFYTRFTDGLQGGLYYQYMKTFYYHRNTAGINLKITL